MPLPELTVGLVIRYDYLWHRRAEAGADGADKERPACVVVALDDPLHGQSVMLLPITHAPPIGDQLAVELPAAVKAALGLDEDRSWVIVSECNIDSWPTPDIRPLPRQPGIFHYGHLPPRLYRAIREKFLEAYRARRVRQVRR